MFERCHLTNKYVTYVPRDVTSNTVVFIFVVCGKLALELPRPLAASAKPYCFVVNITKIE